MAAETGLMLTARKAFGSSGSGMETATTSFRGFAPRKRRGNGGKTSHLPMQFQLTAVVRVETLAGNLVFSIRPAANFNSWGKFRRFVIRWFHEKNRGQFRGNFIRYFYKSQSIRKAFIFQATKYYFTTFISLANKTRCARRYVEEIIALSIDQFRRRYSRREDRCHTVVILKIKCKNRIGRSRDLGAALSSR